MSLGYFKAIFYAALLGSILFVISFFDGTVIFDYRNLHEEFSLKLFLQTMLLLSIFVVLIFEFLQMILNIPRRIQRVLYFRKANHIEKLLIERVLNARFAFDRKENILNSIDFGKRDNISNILALLFAEKLDNPCQIEVFASRLLKDPRTEQLGHFYMARYYYKMQNYTSSLSVLLHLHKNYYHKSKLLMSLDGAIFLNYINVARRGEFTAEKFIYFDTCCEVITNTRISYIVSTQALFLQAHGATSLELDKLNERAWELDRDNLESFSYRCIHSQLGLSTVNQELIFAFQRIPHIKIIETLETINTTNGMSGVFNSLKKVLKKMDDIMPDTLFCMAKAAAAAHIWSEALDYLTDVENSFGKQMSIRTGLLRIEIEKAKNGLTDEVFNLQDSLLKNARKDVFKCRLCGCCCSTPLEYCEHCGEMRSLVWELI